MILLPEIDYPGLLRSGFWVCVGSFPGFLFNLWVLVQVLTVEKEKRSGVALLFSIVGLVFLLGFLVLLTFDPPGEKAVSWFELVGTCLLVGGSISLVPGAFALIALAEYKGWVDGD